MLLRKLRVPSFAETVPLASVLSSFLAPVGASKECIASALADGTLARRVPNSGVDIRSYAPEAYWSGS